MTPGTEDLFLGEDAQRSRVPPIKATSKPVPALGEVITNPVTGQRVASLGKVIQDKDTAILLVASADEVIAPLAAVPCEMLKLGEDGKWTLETGESRLILLSRG